MHIWPHRLNILFFSNLICILSIRLNKIYVVKIKHKVSLITYILDLFQISSLPSNAVVSAPLFNGIVYTNYNRWSSWPLLHLPGWSDGTAVSIAIAMFLAYYLYAFMTASPISLLPIKRSMFIIGMILIATYCCSFRMGNFESQVS